MLAVFFVEIFLGHIVFRNFVGPYFALVGIGRIFDALDDFGFKGVPFFKELVYAFRVRTAAVSQTLQISRLPAGARARPFGSNTTESTVSRSPRAGRFFGAVLVF